ncbi:MAG: alcohol dehydrogenase catalytic domain-containing protein [Nitrososphaeraceae archaeon]
MEAARIVKPNKSLQLAHLQIPRPKGSQVLIRVHSAGVCHSDIHLWEGGYEGAEGKFLKATDRGVKYPLTPGHEVAGMVDSLGEDSLDRFKKNEKVLVYPWVGEGLCPACRAGEENLCDSPRSLGIYKDGGYADYLLVPSYRYLVRVGEGIEMDAAATLPCSALTAYNAVKNATLRPDDNVVVVGAGGLGLMGIQLIKSLYGSRVITLDLEKEKLKAAKENGSDDTVNPKEGDVVKTIMDMTHNTGADAVIDFVNATKTMETNMQILRRRARVVLVGLF